MKRLILVLLGMFFLVSATYAKDLSEFEMFDKVIELQSNEDKKFSDGNGIWDSYYDEEISITYYTHFPSENNSEKFYAIIITNLNNKQNRIMFKADFSVIKGRIWFCFENGNLQFETIAKLDWRKVYVDYSTGEFVEVE